tara:strand:- start:712 stop:2103 length:1392 start_codon:yes stop_codon:yes gene_type:complete
MSEPERPRILIADDEPLYLKTTGQLLRKAGYDCVCVSDAHSAIEKLQTEAFDLILSDLNMPGNLKLELLHEGRKNWSHIPLIVVTGVPSLPSAIESIRLGITDYLLKPVKYEDLLVSVKRVLSLPSLKSKQARLKEPAELVSRFPSIVGSSEPMLEVLDIIDRIAETNANILITGESGTGKEVVAQAIHQHSHRSEERFQVIDCTSIPESLFESILFGHAKGAFTGAIKDQVGLLTLSHQGTAFFDEIGELPAASQSKLLRVIQESSFTPVGKSTVESIDTRFICATNRILELEVSAGRFRRDLFYRLGVIQVELPPLRERGEDVVLLAEHFLKQSQADHELTLQFSAEALDCFRNYSWPGNIRELRNVIERAVALARSKIIEIGDLPETLRRQGAAKGNTSPDIATGSREEVLDTAEYSYLISLLKKYEGNISQAAQQAGLSRQGLHKLLKKHCIAASDYRD